jgi:hypothetical protein
MLKLFLLRRNDGNDERWHGPQQKSVGCYLKGFRSLLAKGKMQQGKNQIRPVLLKVEFPPKTYKLNLRK